MSHVIGRGRYARETYPKRRAGSSLLQQAYARVIDSEGGNTFAIADGVDYTNPAAFIAASFPLDVAAPGGQRFGVTLTGLTPGSQIEVLFIFGMQPQAAASYNDGIGLAFNADGGADTFLPESLQRLKQDYGLGNVSANGQVLDLFDNPAQSQLEIYGLAAAQAGGATDLIAPVFQHTSMLVREWG